MSSASEAVERLLGIMARLRGPGGCPWDREQTLQTLRPYVLEETYEVLEAIDGGDVREHCEELGDLLLQIVFQAQLAQEAGSFGFADVATAISDKLVSRHPHVFGNADVKDAEGVLKQWAALKREEKRAKGGGESVLEGVPREMPALARADRLTEKASRIGFDWPDAAGAREKLSEEIGELDRAMATGDRDEIEHELGDVL
ncbi:MAG TPA: nucleoside triphosphate pyrophosphohydrolase, partial [Anaeromyxobacter sp.]